MDPAFPPFHIAGNLYYAGTKALASYLVTTPNGLILINSDLERNVPQIRASIEQLGFSDVKILLISHAHGDHDAGGAKIKALTGAKYMVMGADVPVESAGKLDIQYGSDVSSLYPPTHADRVLHDGDHVTLSDATLVAHLTPGHTKGCTTWTMKVTEGAKTLGVVIVGSPNVNPGYKPVGNAQYPAIAQDFQKTFHVLKARPCDIFLGAHGAYLDMEKKYEKFKAGDPTAFVDPEATRRTSPNASRRSAWRSRSNWETDGWARVVLWSLPLLRRQHATTRLTQLGSRLVLEIVLVVARARRTQTLARALNDNYATRRARALATSRREAPTASSARIKSSSDTLASPASSFATRAWLEPNCFASAVCVSPVAHRRSRRVRLKARRISTGAASSGVSFRKPAASPTLHPAASRRFRFFVSMLVLPSELIVQSKSPGAIGEHARRRLRSSWHRYAAVVTGRLAAIAQRLQGHPHRGTLQKALS